jgi:hypothetical protein
MLFSGREVFEHRTGKQLPLGILMQNGAAYQSGKIRWSKEWIESWGILKGSQTGVVFLKGPNLHFAVHLSMDGCVTVIGDFSQSWQKQIVVDFAKVAIGEEAALRLMAALRSHRNTYRLGGMPWI